ncbi:hypothetical protein OPV22_028378 [Ensete ventricosum]|uniref:Uncharacterized protein n=1 Tax=Ensete ventricosum TaxID=4639 RepID=A0AAV8P519_ENSVE|nr:hypothetical protein OPV22_028378 [Ensete ventricosum]
MKSFTSWNWNPTAYQVTCLTDDAIVIHPPRSISALVVTELRSFDVGKRSSIDSSPAQNLKKGAHPQGYISFLKEKLET